MTLGTLCNQLLVVASKLCTEHLVTINYCLISFKVEKLANNLTDLFIIGSAFYNCAMIYVIYTRMKNILKNERKSRDAAAKKKRYKRSRDK